MTLGAGHASDLLDRLDLIRSVEAVPGASSEHPRQRMLRTPKSPLEISREARILSVADVFQALAQDRPYHPVMAPEQIVTILRELVQADRLDPDIVEQVVLEPELCWEIATSGTLMPDPS
jgi:hypothetical protein